MASNFKRNSITTAQRPKWIVNAIGCIRTNQAKMNFIFLSLVTIKTEKVLGKCQPYCLYFDCIEQDGTLYSVDK